MNMKKKKKKKKKMMMMMMCYFDLIRCLLECVILFVSLSFQLMDYVEVGMADRGVNPSHFLTPPTIFQATVSSSLPVCSLAVCVASDGMVWMRGARVCPWVSAVPSDSPLRLLPQGLSAADGGAEAVLVGWWGVWERVQGGQRVESVLSLVVAERRR